MPSKGLVLKALRDLRWQAFWYGLGLAFMAAIVVYVYPSYSEQLGDFEIPEAFKPLLGEADFTSPEGFLSGEFFGWTPIIVVIFAIMAGTNALAGEESNGTLDMLQAAPLSRQTVAVSKLLGVLFAACGIIVITVLGWLISVPFVDMDISWGKLLVATLNLLPITLFFVALSLCASVLTRTRGAATGAVTGFAVLTFFVNYLGALVDVLEPLRWLSPFFHSHGSDVLSDGIDWLGLAVLLGFAAALTLVALRGYERRDLGVSSSGGPSLRLPFLRRSREAS